MTKEIQNQTHDRVKSHTEAKLENDRVETRQKIVREIDGPEALSIIKAYEEKARRNAAHLPNVELVDSKIEAERLNKTLEENHSWKGRSRANCERDLRDTFATLPSDGIAKLQKDYQERFGKSLTDTINSDDKISPETKAALAIYMKGADNRTDKDTIALADIAVKAKNLDMFQETFRDASSGARKQYIEQAGVAKVGEAFTNEDQTHALEYLAQGKETTVTKINESIGTFNDNEKAIDAALKGMTDTERQAYINGKAVAEKLPESKQLSADSYNSLKEQEKSDFDQYRQVHDALKKVGNGSEVLRWDDLIVNKDQTLVGKLAAHGGIINDRVDSLMVDIENMKKSDFDRLKTDPHQRETLEQAIATSYGGKDLEQAKELLNKKLSFDTFEEAQTNGNRTTVDTLKDKISIFGIDDQAVLDSLTKMTVEEQKRYREDVEYKEQIDTLVDTAFHNRPQGVAAQRMLAAISAGEKPQEDIVVKLALQAFDLTHDKSARLSDVEAALKADSSLAQRLRNPQTEEDKETAAKFQDYGQRTFGISGYDQYVKPLLDNGELPLSQKVKINDGLIDDDLKGVLNAIKTASKEDRSKLVAAPEDVLPFLSKDERQLAVAVAEQGGAMRPEDKMRAAILGMSGDKETIKELSSELSEEQRQQLAQDYERQYGKNLVSDLSDKLSGQDEIEAVRNFKNLLSTARESFNQARDEEYQSNDGIGRSFVRNHWDGTADTSRDSLNQYAADMTTYAREHQEMPKDEVVQNKTNLASSLDLFRESKAGAADAIADGAIIAVGVGGSVYTGGASLELIGATGLAGSALKVGSKSSIMGDDYHFEGGQLLSDATSGAVVGATSVLGPGHMARMLNISDTAVASSSSALKNTLQEVALNSGAGSVAGGSSGLIEGVKNWDSGKRLDENLKLVGEEALSGAALGLVMGGGTSIGLKGLGTGFRETRDFARGHFSDVSRKADDLILDANGRITEINALNQIKVSYHENGAQQGAVNKIEMANGNSYESLGGDKWRVVEGGNSQGREIEGAISLSHIGEIQIRQANGNTKTISGVEGWVKEFDKASGQTNLRDADGRLLSFEARNGHNSQYQYDNSGKLSQIEFANGHTIRSEDGGKSWMLKTKTDGELKPIKGEVTFDGDGNVHIKPHENMSHEPEQIFRKDGSYSNIDAATGKPSSMVKANGQHEIYEYAADGSLSRLSYLDKNGKLLNDAHDGVEIDIAGNKITNFGKTETVELTDGGLIVRRSDSLDILGEKPPANLKLAGETDTTARSSTEALEQRKFIQQQFASTETVDNPRTIRETALELKSVKVSSADGQTSTVYDSLMKNEVLSHAQKENVLRNLAQAREHLTGRPTGDGLKNGDPDNLLHTQVAIGTVLDLSRTNKLTAAETEDALLASVYSNSLKAAQTKLDGATANSLSRPLHADLVAEHVLSRDGLPPQRVERVVEAIKAQHGEYIAPDVQIDPAFKQLSELQKQEAQSRIRVTQTVSDSNVLARQASADGSVTTTADTPGTSTKAKQPEKSLLESRPLELPGIKAEEIKAGEKTWENPDNHLKAWRSEKSNYLYVMDTQSNIMRTFDSENRLRMVIDGDSSREIHYGSTGDIESVKLKSKSDGEYTITGGFGKELKVDADGTVKAIKRPIDGDGDVNGNANENGAEVTRYNLDGSSERILLSGRIEYEQANYTYEKARLQENFKQALDSGAIGLDSLARINKHLAEFEQEATKPSRNLDQNTQALFYKQLNRLVAENPDAVVPLDRRLIIAEEALQHSAHPETVCQGANKTCNVTTVEHRIYWRTPDKNVQLLADVAQTGKYRFASGSEIDLRNSSGKLSIDRNSDLDLWARNVFPKHGPPALVATGYRDFSSEILQTSMVNSHWKRTIAVNSVDANGRILNEADMAMRYDKNGEALGIVNKRNVALIYDESGQRAKQIEPGTAYYLGDNTAVTNPAELKAVYSKDGQLQGFATQSTDIKPVYDITGKKVQTELDSSVASGKYFDETGNLLVHYVHPGDIEYRKVQVRSNRDAERLLIELNGEVKELKRPNDRPLNSPQLGATDLQYIGNDITGLNDKTFVLENGRKHADVIGFNSEEELIAAFRKLESEKNLPAIITVDAVYPPFNSAPRTESTSGFNRGHVINGHGVFEAPDPRAGREGETITRVKWSNQWGTNGDKFKKIGVENSLEEGIPSSLFYQLTVPYKTGK